MQKRIEMFFGIIVLLFSSVTVFAQQSLVVKSLKSDGSPIPYCTVAWSPAAAFVTDEKGTVTIPDKSAIRDSIVVSTVGYKSKSINKNEVDNKSSIEITLEENVVILPDVQISTVKNFIEVGYYEKKGGKSYYTNRSLFSMELAQLITGYSAATYLSEFAVFVEKQSEEHLPFRVRFYKNENSKPGVELSSSEIIVSKYKSNSWNVVHVDTLDIHVPADGFFISIQWLVGSAPDKRKLNVGLTDKFDPQPFYSFDGNSGWVSVRGKNGQIPFNLLVTAKLLSN